MKVEASKGAKCRSNIPRFKPFLKWAGGKSQLLGEILPLIPSSFNKYVEPFLGGGALFFALAHNPSIISDANEELIITYIAIRDEVSAVIEELKRFRNTKELFYEVRAWDPSSLPSAKRAARLIFLNKTCFNGLYRVNKNGVFNTPYGGNQSTKFLEGELLLEAHLALQNARIISGDYKCILQKYAKAGDLIFLDPPYKPVGRFSDFKRYTKERFHDNDHVELARTFNDLVDRGRKVILTNSAHESIFELYMGYDCRVVNSKRLISSKVTTRNGKDLIVLGGF